MFSVSVLSLSPSSNVDYSEHKTAINCEQIWRLQDKLEGSASYSNMLGGPNAFLTLPDQATY
jgi:hypothetical protein